MRKNHYFLLLLVVFVSVPWCSTCEESGGLSVDESTPSAILRSASPLRFRGARSPDPEHPGDTDCNSPAHWDGDTLYVFNSSGHPWRSAGPDLFHLNTSYMRAEYDNQANGGRWIESTWKDEEGTLYGWYHHEPRGVVPGTGLTAPKIGALRSDDNGASWKDLGIVLETRPGAFHLDTPNRYFVGGNGDFSVIPDRKKEYLYLFISTYSGEKSEQGVAVARMRYQDRNQPGGRVRKWYGGKWNEPGIGGRATPIFPLRVDWHQENVDAFWGPSIHWNTHLNLYVILLNRAIDKEWKQEGVYVTFNRDLSDPNGWSTPKKILSGLRPTEWYPQVIGLSKEKRETDKLAGRVARLFARGESRWEIIFLKPGERQNP